MGTNGSYSGHGMPGKRPLAVLLLTTVLLLAGLAAPAGANDTVQGSARIAGGDGQSAIGQAYVCWLVAKQESGMDATIGYIAAINGSTLELTSIRDTFHAGFTGPCESGSDAPDCSIAAYRDLARQFQDETRIRMAAAGGDESKLAAAVEEAAMTDARVKAAEERYWMIRMAAEPASFDRYVSESQATLLALQEHGYDTTSAQEVLDRIAGMRSEFVSAISAQDYDAAEAIRERIDSTAAEFEGMVRHLTTGA